MMRWKLSASAISSTSRESSALSGLGSDSEKTMFADLGAERARAEGRVPRRYQPKLLVEKLVRHCFKCAGSVVDSVMRTRALVAVAALAVALVGCGPSRQSVPLVDLDAPVPAELARVVLARRANVWVAQGRRIEVRDERGAVGLVAPGALLAWERAPGRAVVSTESGERLPLDLEAGRTTCIEMEVGAGGWPVSTRMTVVDAGNLPRLRADFQPPQAATEP